MKNVNSKIAIGIAILFEIILIINIIFSISSRQWKNLYLYFIAVVCITVPFIITKIANIKKITLPCSFRFISLIFILFALYFGEIMQFYTKFWWWDLFLHGAFGCYAVIVGLHLMQGSIIKAKEVTKKRFTILALLLSFCFAITLGTIWEMIEFIADYFFKTDMVNGGLEDTATDLLIKILGAFITSIIYYYKKIRNKLIY